MDAGLGLFGSVIGCGTGVWSQSGGAVDRDCMARVFCLFRLRKMDAQDAVLVAKKQMKNGFGGVISFGLADESFFIYGHIDGSCAKISS